MESRRSGLEPEQNSKLLIDRALGDYWSQVFADGMMKNGFATHRFDKAPSPVVNLPNGGHIILADVLVLRRGGAACYCEVKHKAPTQHGTYGLEEYRFNSLLALTSWVEGAVLYVIHNHSLSGGRDSPTININHWVYVNVHALQGRHVFKGMGKSYVNGKEKTVPMLYWSQTLWHPLKELIQTPLLAE